ncbi:MAG: FAD-dependent monooxygenase, partial [Bacteroidota bacterium]|nr:FAD-dependent monooxygenase [Bacteroidota bacterium]
MYDVIIVGGGLAGLVNAIMLSTAGFKVLLIEKKSYPFDKVCGEYVSNEVVTFLQSINAYPIDEGAAHISRLQLSSVSGSSATLQLPLGGFGISRLKFDQYLYEKAKASGAEFLLDTIVETIDFDGNNFSIDCREGKRLNAEIVIGAYGKRSGIDKTLKRAFFFKRSPYLGIKYHIKTDFPRDLVS